jgi:hypothetical protein
MPLGKLTFALIYKMVIGKKLREVSFNELAAGPIEAYRARMGRQSTTKHIWRAGALVAQGRQPPVAEDELIQELNSTGLTSEGSTAQSVGWS